MENIDRDVELINLTDHPLDIGNGWSFVRLDSYGRARVDSKMIPRERVRVNGQDVFVPILSVTEQDVTGLPRPRDGVLYVVSGIVASAAAELGRRDVVAPARVERENGKVKSARALIRIEKKEG